MIAAVGAAPAAFTAPAAVGATSPRPELRPVSATQWSLRVTLDEALKGDLDELRELTSHATRGDLVEVLRDAVRCALEQHRKRRAASLAKRPREPIATACTLPSTAASALTGAASSANVPLAAPELTPSAPSGPIGAIRHVPAAVRRDVWARDGGRCTFTSRDGRRCGSRWMLELDHLRPAALGGRSTADNLRVVCRAHNIRNAELAFGGEAAELRRWGQRRRGCGDQVARRGAVAPTASPS